MCSQRRLGLLVTIVGWTGADDNSLVFWAKWSLVLGLS